MATMTYSLTVAALLHPWSGRLDIVTRLPLRQYESAISTNLQTAVESYPITRKKSRIRCKSLSIDLSWKINVQGNNAQYEVAEEEESTSSATETQNDILSSEDATYECSDNVSESVEVETTDICETKQSTCDADTDKELSKAIKALLIPPPILKMSPSAMYQNEFFEVAKSTVAGWGAFATRDLAKGDIILRETPLFVAHTNRVFGEFYKLDTDAKKVALSLHSHHLIKGGTPPILAVFSVSRHEAGLFPIAARFNHACDPVNNVEYEFDHEHDVLTMVVREDVAVGTELKISYGKNLSPQDLYLCYGFRCGCGGAREYGEYSDLELVCDGQTLAAHKLVVCTQSKIVRLSDRELNSKVFSRYKVNDCSFGDLQKIIDYLYTGDYDTVSEVSSGQQRVDPEIILHARMFGLASTYSIDGLIRLSEEKFDKAFEQGRMAEDSIQVQVIIELYALQPALHRRLGDRVVSSIRARMEASSLQNTILGSLDEITRKAPAFASDLIRSFVKTPGSRQCSECGDELRTRPETKRRKLGAQNNGEFCDLQIVCNGHVLPVHRVIVCLQSPVIKAACTGSFAESEGSYEIKDCSYDTVKRMVDYLYTGNYEVYQEEPPEEPINGPSWASACETPLPSKQPPKKRAPSELIQHVKMYCLADKYLIDGLLTLSKNEFKKAIRDERNTATFCEFVAEVYDLQFESSQALREIVVESVRERIAVPPLKPKVQEALDGVLDEVPEFAADLARSYIRRPLLGHCTTCGSHKLVKVSTLQFIKSACTGPYKEASGRYEIKDASFEAVQQMVAYFYTGDYAASEPMFHLKLFSLADKYLITGLLHLSKTKFREAVRREQDPCILLQYVAKTYALQGDPGRDFRNNLVDAIAERIAASPSSMDIQGPLDSAMDEVYEFAKDLVQCFVKRSSSGCLCHGEDVEVDLTGYSDFSPPPGPMDNVTRRQRGLGLWD
ncbi:hypothetical protein V8C35DRAFT_275055 [Trichoderma chlorosporum]